MRNSLRIILLVIAFFVVSFLGYYAYLLQARTLTYAIGGLSDQRGSIMRIAVERPILSGSGQSLFVTGAIMQALSINGAPLANTGLVSLYETGNSIVISTSLEEKQILSLDASTYNNSPGVHYRFPSDIELEVGATPSIYTESIGLPRDRRYKIELSGFSTSIDPSLLKLYQMRRSSPESNYCNPDLLDYQTPVKYHTIATYKSILKNTLEIQSFHELDGAYCLFAVLSSEVYPIESRTISPLSLTGVAIDVLSPEYDMQSRIQFDFSNPIFSDTGATNSREYILHRTNEKTLFLKHIQITPEIPLSLDNLVMTPDRAIIRLPLTAGLEYTVKLVDIEDIYGKKGSLEFKLLPKREPYLSLALSGGVNTIPTTKPVWAKMFSLDTKRAGHNIMLCRLDLESYARMERIVDENKSEYTDEMYELFGKLPEKNCIRKEILTAKNNHLSTIDISQFFPDKKQVPGLYSLAFADKTDSIYTSKWLRPLVFSLVDTHITMKLDASGKSLFFATDLSTGSPLEGQEIRIYKNIGRSYTETWNPTTEALDIEYLPLSTRTFATGITLGKTDKDGYLSVDLKDKFDGDTAYGFTYEDWWGYEGSYRSFLVESRSATRAGYVVSTWNDGIAGWNFGFKDSDYGWSSRIPYLAYSHTDRRLYLPGETVHIHTIVRDYNEKLLVPPTGRMYNVKVYDPNGKEVYQTNIKPSEFGSLSTDWKIPEGSPLGNYSVQITLANATRGEEYMDGGYTSFQVEIFKNPTFTSTISLSSTDIDNEMISNLRKKENVNPDYYWYSDIYEGTFNLDGNIKANYYNGALVRNVPFTYRVYRSEYWGNEVWNDCFWGCYYEPPLEMYTEGEGMIDSDGLGFFRVPVLFSSYYADYRYTVEVTIQDPLTSETVTSANNMIVRMPSEYRMYDTTNPLTFKPTRKILAENSVLTGSFEPARGKWSEWYRGKYQYELFLRNYDVVQVDDIRGGKTEIMNPVDTVVATGSIMGSYLSVDMKGKSSGEYHLRVLPIGTLSGTTESPGSSETVVYYVSQDKTSKNPRIANNTISVISEKTVYKLGEEARVLVRLPWVNAKVLVTIEKGGVIEKIYMNITGNMFDYKFLVDDRFLPNAYIGVLAFGPNSSGSLLPEYQVGYTEIVTDLSEKKASLQVASDKTEYKTRETVSLSLDLKDKYGKPLVGEVSLMVVDESLISLLGNIDLDIIPKFYQKLPFSLRTSLSIIGMEERRYFSRRGIAGGSGGKGGDGSAISTRTLFDNTVYYNPSVITNASGKATVKFPLTDSITNYRIIAIASTKASHFGVSESTINVRKDFVIEPHAPTIIRTGDTFTIDTNLFNFTDRITPVTLTLSIDPILFTGSFVQSGILQPKSPESKVFTLRYLGDSTNQKITYTLQMAEGKNILDRREDSLEIMSDPLFEKRTIASYEFTGSALSVPLEKVSPNTNLAKSLLAVDVSTSILSSSRDIFRTLLQYPYGCVEQTTSSTLPNAIALALQSTLPNGTNIEEARNNIASGVARLATLQSPSGGFVYWQGDMTENPEITPYVIRSLITMKNLGGEVPADMISRGVDYLIQNEYAYSNANSQAERFWTLALAKHSDATKAKNTINTSDLTLHGWVAYLYGLHLIKNLDDATIKTFEEKYLSSKPLSEDTLWYYWNKSADMMLYARLLLDRGEKPRVVFDRFMRHTLSYDWSSYYISTQEKLQTFLTLARYLELEKASITGSIRFSLASGTLKTDNILDQNTILVRRNLDISKIGSTLDISKAEANTLYIRTTKKELPLDPYIVPSLQNAGVQVTRTIEYIDERLGVDEDGKFISATPVTDGIFKKGSLYRIRITAILAGYNNKSWTNFVLEDYLPGGWRPIQSKFLTTSSLITNNVENNWSWSYTESQKDRVFAHASYGYGKDISYEYFIRPEQSGTYLLPPVTAYFLYRPEVRGYGKYMKVEIR